MSYFCLFFLKGLIKVLFLDLNETSVVENCLPATSHKSNYLTGLRSYFELTFDSERSYFLSSLGIIKAL